MPKPLLIAVLIVSSIIFWRIDGLRGTIVGVTLTVVLSSIIWEIRKKRYFNSEGFRTLQADTTALVSARNDLVNYIAEIRSRGSFVLGASTSGQHAHLARFEEPWLWRFLGERENVEYSPYVYNASLPVLHRASLDPVKYLIKYFNIKADQQTLAEVQRVAQDTSRLEEALDNVKSREDEIIGRISPPSFILKRYSKEFWRCLGGELPPKQMSYLVYTFQYTSPAGNSSRTLNVDLNTPTLDAILETLVRKIRWPKKSAAGQRMVITSRLRTRIKTRDNNTCCFCGISAEAQPNLLLEVDHIVPLSQGGFSEPSNLQTLCWRCKWAKIDDMPTHTDEGTYVNERSQKKRPFDTFRKLASATLLGLIKKRIPRIGGFSHWR